MAIRGIQRDSDRYDHCLVRWNGVSSVTTILRFPSRFVEQARELVWETSRKKPGLPFWTWCGKWPCPPI